MLNNFFTINLPYGIQKHPNADAWMAFNREYKPLGFNKNSKTYNPDDFDIWTAYKGLGEAKLLKLAWCEDAVRRDSLGKINQVFFYNDELNPTINPQHFDKYFTKIKILAKLQRTTLKKPLNTFLQPTPTPIELKRNYIESQFAIGDEVWYVTGNGIPRQSRIDGLIFANKNQVVEFVLDDRGERGDGELFPTLEALAAKRKFISPANAIRLLQKNEQQRIKWLNTNDIAYLKEKALEYNQSKATKKKKT